MYLNTFQCIWSQVYWKYVSNIFTFENDSSDPDTPKPEKLKKFWSFVKSLKKDAFGIASLRENGILKTDTKEKSQYMLPAVSISLHTRRRL